jgi:hypothetical protein
VDVDRRLIPYAEVDRRLSRTDLFNLETLECVVGSVNLAIATPHIVFSRLE